MIDISVTLIAAYIGGNLSPVPWELDTVWAVIGAKTQGAVLFMGGGTYAQLKPRLTDGNPSKQSERFSLADTRKVVISRGMESDGCPGCIRAYNLEHALTIAEQYAMDEIYVVGGGFLFGHMEPLASELLLIQDQLGEEQSSVPLPKNVGRQFNGCLRATPFYHEKGHLLRFGQYRGPKWKPPRRLAVY